MGSALFVVCAASIQGLAAGTTRSEINCQYANTHSTSLNNYQIPFLTDAHSTAIYLYEAIVLMHHCQG